MRIKILILLTLMFSSAYGQTPEHGTVIKSETASWKVWDSSIKDWSDIDSFWSRYTESKGGLTWKRSDTYPKYDDVKEFDTLLIETKQGTCLMEFYHSRWRRANDVRRWDKAFNEYSGCPYVFR
ncbi:MAG: hypothetical protein ACI9CB_002875 [Rhodothermales bacterium]|jgi:hypothetical protein